MSGCSSFAAQRYVLVPTFVALVATGACGGKTTVQADAPGERGCRALCGAIAGECGGDPACVDNCTDGVADVFTAATCVSAWESLVDCEVIHGVVSCSPGGLGGGLTQPAECAAEGSAFYSACAQQ